MVKLIVDYFYDVEGEEPSVIRKIYQGLDEEELVRRSRENEHYSTCTSVQYDVDYGY